MVVVLDAIESEKLDLDIADEGGIRLEDEEELKKSRRFRPLSRRGKTILSLAVATFAVALTLLSVSLAGRGRHRRDHEFYSSYSEDTSNANQGFTFLNRLVNDEKTESLFL